MIYKSNITLGKNYKTVFQKMFTAFRNWNLTPELNKRKLTHVALIWEFTTCEYLNYSLSNNKCAMPNK